MLDRILIVEEDKIQSLPENIKTGWILKYVAGNQEIIIGYGNKKADLMDCIKQFRGTHHPAEFITLFIQEREPTVREIIELRANNKNNKGD